MKLRWYIGGLCFLLLGGCVSREYSVLNHRSETYFYSSDKEQSIGRNLAAEVKKEYTVMNDPAMIARTENILNALSAVSDRQEVSYHIAVIDDTTRNAFSLPGGYIFIFKGLLDSLKEDDQLAFVVAHEMGHVVARHHIKRLQAAWGMNLLVLASSQIKDADLLPLGVSSALAFILSGFAQEDELQADSLAIKYLTLAGFSPKSSIDVLNKLWEFRKKEPSEQYSYIKTHPDTGLRIKSAKETLGIPLEFKDYLNSLQ